MGTPVGLGFLLVSQNKLWILDIYNKNYLCGQGLFIQYELPRGIYRIIFLGLDGL